MNDDHDDLKMPSKGEYIAAFFYAIFLFGLIIAFYKLVLVGLVELMFKQ